MGLSAAHLVMAVHATILVVPKGVRGGKTMACIRLFECPPDALIDEDSAMPTPSTRPSTSPPTKLHRRCGQRGWARGNRYIGQYTRSQVGSAKQILSVTSGYDTPGVSVCGPESGSVSRNPLIPTQPRSKTLLFTVRSTWYNVQRTAYIHTTSTYVSTAGNG